ncbi:type II toxin-antitoxin system Phd/YefM family antitoxin [Alicyclobacillaceae bacterium I2511]|nr:type II toxin-antitoxin system Phd/YefM family antitoxin [Alicyclobacillaceae bacterium I2511]
MKEQQVMKSSDVREHWSEVINLVSRDQARVVVEKSGVPVAGLVSPEDLEWLKQRDSRLMDLRRVMDQMRDAFVDVPEDEFNKEVERALSGVRSGLAGQGTEGEA